MTFSESFYFTMSGLTLSGIAVALWYFRSTLMTSRCSEVQCCFGLLSLKNKVVEDNTLTDLVARDQAPQIMSTAGRHTTETGIQSVYNRNNINNV